MNSAFAFRLINALLMSLLVASLMTGWVTWLNLGLPPDFLARWARVFLNAWPAAFIIVLLTGPGVQRLSRWLLQSLAARLPQPKPQEESR